MYPVRLRCKRCKHVMVAYKKDSRSFLRFYPTCKVCGNRSEWGPTIYHVIESCPIHPEHEIDNTTGNYCPECFKIATGSSGSTE
jgi:hypothetical protein